MRINKALVLGFLAMGTLTSWAQGVAINETGVDPVASAILDVTSTSKGILVPRMTAVQRNAIAAPADGLMVYQTDGIAGFYYFSGTASAWRSFAATANNGLSVDAGTGDILLGGTLTGNTIIDLAGNGLDFENGQVTVRRGTGDDVFIHYDGQNNGISWTAGVEDSNNADFIISNASDLSDPKLFVGGAGGGFNGNVGIGTASPFTALGVNGLAYIAGDDDNNFGGNPAGFVFPPTIDLSIDDNDTGLDVPSDGTLSIYTNGGERLRVNSVGNVGIGITTPTQRLNVRGNALLTGISSGPFIGAPVSSYLYFSSTSGVNTVDWSTGLFTGGFTVIGTYRFDDHLLFRQGNSVIAAVGQNSFVPGIDAQYDLGNAGNSGSGNQRWRNLYLSGFTITASDRRFKKDISQLGYGLNEVLKMNPVSYRMISDSDNDLKFGLIAQEVRELLPELVIEDNSKEKHLSLKYTELIPVLINAIKEQQKIIDQKEKSIKALEAKVSKVETEVVEIEGMKKDLIYLKKLLSIETPKTKE